MDIDNLKKFNDMPKSYWIDSTKDTDYPTLNSDKNVDIAIVGGGMVGITTAYQLQKYGMNVAVLERGKIVENTTAHTTAKLTSQHDLIYTKLINGFGKDLAMQYASANEFAISELKKIADENNIDCDYSIQPAFTYTQDDDFAKLIEKEVESAKSLGISASFVEEIPLPIPIKAGIKFDNQAQFHPRKFLLPLAKLIHDNGVQIYENARVIALDENKENNYILTTSDNHKVIANKVIVASHYPFYNKLGAYYTRLYQSRAYAIVIKAKEKFPGGMFISAEQPNRSMRGLNTSSGDYILVVGDSHKSGQGGDTNRHYESLIDFASSLFTVEDILYRWSTQDCMTMDGIPYIGGFTSETPNLYIATGFNKWGMTNSLVSSILLKDLIIKKSNPWHEIYSPSRKNFIPAIKEFSKQNLNVATNLVGGKVENVPKNVDIEVGEGKVIEIDGNKVGAFKDESENLHLINPVCTHMGCDLNWNSAERSWDCPCHGSRFDIDGNIINTPAVHPLDFDLNINTIAKLIKEDF